jgi:hypothetical protein
MCHPIPAKIATDITSPFCLQRTLALVSLRKLKAYGLREPFVQQ